MLSNTKYKKIIIVVCIILLFYSVMIISAKKIEMFSTFPALHIDFENPNKVSLDDLNYEEINIKSKNGENINGLYIGDGKGETVYYFHGNGGPLNYFYNEIKYIHSLGYNVMAYDYPGYGKSTGKPYKKNIENFSEKFYEYFKNQKNIRSDELIIWGYSVGTAVAVDFASKNNFEKIILISPLSSRYDMGSKLFGFPIQKFLFLKNTFETAKLVKNFSKPVLIIHGNKDKIVPFKQGEKVFDNYGLFFINYGVGDKIKKYFVEIDNFGHNGIIFNYGEILRYKLEKFLKYGKLNFERMFLDEKQIDILKNENKIFGADLKTDDSMTKFVNNKVSFDKLNYKPNDLENINSEYVFDSKGYSTLRREANLKLQELAKDFYKYFGRKLVVVSAYRSYEYQKGIKNRGCPDNLCSKPGFSEHQTGLAVDIFSASTRKEWQNNRKYSSYFDWFNKNAYKYGFHNTYQKGLAVDGYEIEPWHWRYLGYDLAKYLNENKMTFAQFYY